jgi:hypothetical protein
VTTFAENDVRKNNNNDNKPLTMFNKKSSGRRRRGNRRKKSEMSSRLMQDETDRSQHSSHHDYVKKSSRNFPCSSKRSQHGKNDNKTCSQSAAMESFCSTCSSSSDSDSEDFAYKLPERKIYGGVRLNYISNDALSNFSKRNKNDKNNSSSSKPLSFFKLKF